MYPRALTIAGSDSGGGAGIQADLKTFSALDVYGASVIVALTAQNTREVRAIHDVPVPFIVQQIDTVFDDIRIDALKIGMLSQPAIIETVAERLQAHAAKQIVLDPVMVAKSGAALLAPNAIGALRERLLPLATVITPNLPEAAVLLERDAPATEDEMIRAAKDLLALGPRSVVVKGGHLNGAESVDIFYDGEQILRLPAPRVDTKNTHGTGCTFSAAITAYLAHGFALPDAVRSAKDYLSAAIAAADLLDVGSGHGPVHHFHAQWQEA